MEEPSQFSMGQTAQSLACSIVEKPHAGLDDCLRMLQACFTKRMSAHNKEQDVLQESIISLPIFHSEWWRKKDQKVLPFKPAMMNASALQFRSRAVL